MNTGRKSDFVSLMNMYAGKTAIIIGKGRSLDAWLAKGCPQPPGAFRIGINQGAWIVPDVPYSVSGDVQMEEYAPKSHEVGTTFIRGVPYWNLQRQRIIELQPNTGIWFDANTDERVDRLSFSRSELAAHRKLFVHLSSANPALHLAWYMGCVSAILVGIDGGSGRAKALDGLPDRQGPVSYDRIRKSVDCQADALWGNRWSRWA